MHQILDQNVCSWPVVSPLDYERHRVKIHSEYDPGPIDLKYRVGFDPDCCIHTLFMRLSEWRNGNADFFLGVIISQHNVFVFQLNTDNSNAKQMKTQSTSHDISC